MRFAALVIAVVGASQQDLTPLTTSRSPPSVDGSSYLFLGGDRKDWTGPTTEVLSPIFTKEKKRAVIGTLSVMDSKAALETLDEAVKAWDKGQGEWPQKSMAERGKAIEEYLEALQESRSEIVEMLMWEIAKTEADAAKEFDRTIAFAKQVLAAVTKLDRFGGDVWHDFGGKISARVERGPVGVTLMLAPFNYPLNEMYAMMIPALLTGNIVLLKLPSIGALTHVLTVPALEKALPKGVVNFVTGSGRAVLPAVMETGKVDAIGFIGGSKGADALVKAHPHPHRLRVFSQLEGKNMAIVLPDADLETATSEIAVGALSYNGQRCTAIKLIMVHDSIADAFVEKLISKVDALKGGLPWDSDVQITPLPEPKKPKYLAELIDDALSKGAKVLNSNGADVAGALFTPAVVAYVDDSMRLFHEEQFGPVVPVGKFSDVSSIILAAKASWSGQQVAIFTKDDSKNAALLIDTLSTIVGRANLNLQCQRGPDVLPFSGRRSSAMGTMSVDDALKAFSVEIVIATKPSDKSLVANIEAHSNLLAPEKTFP